MKLFRYEDVAVGPRRLPRSGDHTEGKIEMPKDAALEVDVEKKSVMLLDGQKRIDLGEQIAYMVE